MIVDSERGTMLDYDLIKCLVKFAVAGFVLGWIIPMIAPKLGISDLLAWVVCMVGYFVWAYSKIKAEQKQEKEAITAACEKCFMEGAEYARKEKAST